jgi:glycosyltransferase involved in cell wall biosynthesis
MRILWASKGWHSTDRNVVEGLAARGHDVALFSLAERRFDWNVPVLGKEMHALLGPLFGPGQVRAACAEFRPDIVFGNFVTTYGNYVARGTPAGTPVVAVGWGSDLLLHGRWPIVRLLTRAALSGSQLLLANAEHLAEAGRALGAEEVELLPYGIDTDLFRPDLAAPPGWPEADVPTFICTRNLKPLYDHATLIRGLALCAHQPAPRLIIIGDGPEREPLERLAQELDLSSRVLFTGRIDNKLLPAWLAQADIWVSGAHSDGLPLSMLEAMASGLKVVLAALPMTRDWHVPGMSWTFPIADAEGCARSFEAALSSPKVAPDDAQSGRAMVLERGSLEATLNGFERVCSQLLGAAAHQSG